MRNVAYLLNVGRVREELVSFLSMRKVTPYKQIAICGYLDVLLGEKLIIKVSGVVESSTYSDLLNFKENA